MTYELLSLRSNSFRKYQIFDSYPKKSIFFEWCVHISKKTYPRIKVNKINWLINAAIREGFYFCTGQNRTQEKRTIFEWPCIFSSKYFELTISTQIQDFPEFLIKPNLYKIRKFNHHWIITYKHNSKCQKRWKERRPVWKYHLQPYFKNGLKQVNYVICPLKFINSSNAK